MILYRSRIFVIIYQMSDKLYNRFIDDFNKKIYEVGTLESILGIQNREAEKMRTNAQAPSKLINLYVDKYKEAVKYTEVEGLTKGSRFGNKITEVSI